MVTPNVSSIAAFLLKTASSIGSELASSAHISFSELPTPAIQSTLLSKSIERAQRRVEENHFGTRKHLVEYDDVMSRQRETIYQRRRNALQGQKLDIDIDNMMLDNELLEDKADENRIMTETAAMLVKYTINEEIVRLCSHISAMKDEINNNPIPGKRLDFICQEMNREINTIGSKNQFAEVSAVVINAKDALENIREQSKNVE